MQKYPHIRPVFWRYLLWYFPRDVFNTKAIKVCHTTTISRQSCPMSSFLFILIKIYYVRPFLHWFWCIILWINTYKSRFLLVIILYFKMQKSKDEAGLKTLSSTVYSNASSDYTTSVLPCCSFACSYYIAFAFSICYHILTC